MQKIDTKYFQSLESGKKKNKDSKKNKSADILFANILSKK